MILLMINIIINSKLRFRNVNISMTLFNGIGSLFKKFFYVLKLMEMQMEIFSCFIFYLFITFSIFLLLMIKKYEYSLI